MDLTGGASRRPAAYRLAAALLVASDPPRWTGAVGRCWSTDAGARCGRSTWAAGPAGRRGGCRVPRCGAPARTTLAIRRLDFPEPDGSDSFVVWPATGA